MSEVMASRRLLTLCERLCDSMENTPEGHCLSLSFHFTFPECSSFPAPWQWSAHISLHSALCVDEMFIALVPAQHSVHICAGNHRCCRGFLCCT